MVQPSSNPSPVKSQETYRLAPSPLTMATCGVSPLGTSLGPMSPLSNHEEMSVAWLFFTNGLVLWVKIGLDKERRGHVVGERK